jgi:hypothetical protein
MYPDVTPTVLTTSQQRTSWSSGHPPSYLGGPGYDSLPEKLLAFVTFVSICKKMLGQYLAVKYIAYI